MNQQVPCTQEEIDRLVDTYLLQKPGSTLKQVQYAVALKIRINFHVPGNKSLVFKRAKMVRDSLERHVNKGHGGKHAWYHADDPKVYDEDPLERPEA